MIGSHLMIGLEGPTLTQKEKQLLIQEDVAGVILFKRNIINFKQLHDLCSELKSLPKQHPLLLSIDMEGGEVNRFRDVQDSLKWPSAEFLKEQKEEDIFNVAKTLGIRLKAFGFDINFAPVVDLLITDNSLLKSRVFGQSASEIIKKAGAFKEGLLAAGIWPCLKHFPGHGGVSEDSHLELPKDSRTFEDLTEQLNIFKELSQDSCIMTAHIEFSNIDKQPASFSKIFLKDHLRQILQFESVIFSDDIDMDALKDFSASERALKCLEAGCDLILSCQKTEIYEEIFEFFQSYSYSSDLTQMLEASRNRILKLLKHARKPESWNQAQEILENTKHKFT